MKLTILGATGATGICLTRQALAAGHEVTAVVRDPSRLPVPAQPRLRTVTADVMDPASITPAIAGADAVLSVVGPRGTGPTTVIQDSVRSIIQAMRTLSWMTVVGPVPRGPAADRTASAPSMAGAMDAGSMTSAVTVCSRR